MSSNQSSKRLFRQLVQSNFPVNFMCNAYPKEPPHLITWVAMDEIFDANGRRHDVVFAFMPGKKECNCPGMDYRCGVVTVETKSNHQDLMKDGKIITYLGAGTHSFLGVEEELIPAAITKIQSFGDMARYVGLINIKNGDIVIWPHSQLEFLDRTRRDRLLSSMFISPRRTDNPDEEYLQHHYTTGNLEPNSFIEVDELLYNEEYSRHIPCDEK